MASGLNKVYLLGNITRDPEVRYTPKGAACCELGVAVNRTYVTEGGEKREEVVFVDVVAWSKLGELCGQYLKKGSKAHIEGRLQFEEWNDKATGQKRSRLRVVADNVIFLSQREESAAPAQTRQTRPAAGPARPARDDMGDDDIPF